MAISYRPPLAREANWLAYSLSVSQGPWLWPQGRKIPFWRGDGQHLLSETGAEGLLLETQEVKDLERGQAWGRGGLWTQVGNALIASEQSAQHRKFWNLKSPSSFLVPNLTWPPKVIFERWPALAWETGVWTSSFGLSKCTGMAWTEFLPLSGLQPPGPQRR